MQTRPFGKTGLDVSPLGFGAAEIGFLELDEGEPEALIAFLLDRGVNVIDTAAMYRASELLVGRALAGRRDDVVLISKCGTAVDDIDAPAWSAELITQTVDRALSRLRTDRLDVMLLHSCDLPTLQEGSALDALHRAKQAGKIRCVGYSGDNEAAEWAAGHGDVEVLELSVSIADQRNIELVLPLCTEHDKGVLAKRPIANAAWRDIGSQPGLYADYAKTYTERLRRMDLEPASVDSSAAGWAEIALRFTLAQQGVDTAIVGTTSREHLMANIAAAERGPLPAAAVERIYAAFNAAEAQSGSTWLALT